ncbi:MAG: indolepyruvate ferredoxin oxidoreductase family protein, partial [Pseudomonadales bacterium]|nr:indolepyruvate ferredoxin oxidoreductase family protein [Pseudomonadales bacterium]
SLWYGKNPGLDRSMDAIKHGSHAGTSPLGGVLAVAGDDHLAKSSAFGHQSEYGFVDCLMPVLAPSDVADILSLGLFGWALSRYCGSWVGVKLAGSICESSALITLPDENLSFPTPWDFSLPADGVHLRWPEAFDAMEARAKSVKLPAALAFARAAGIDRTLSGDARGDSRGKLGIISSGRAFAQLRLALQELGVSERDFPSLGLRLYKPAMVWPLEPEALLEFLRDLPTVLVVEDKRPLVEDQVKVLLHDRRPGAGTRVIGKHDERGHPLLPDSGEVDALKVALIIAQRLDLPAARGAEIAARVAQHSVAPAQIRLPFFCSGCPHNTSTRVPEGAIAVGGIGCHTLAMGMDRGMLTFSHMGGEGATWIGIAPFSGHEHVFQNLGDGTYQHSGYLGIRAAVIAGVNITFKILYNDAVAMTGGQPVEGLPTVPRMTRQLAAEGVAQVVVVTDEPHKYPTGDAFARGVTVHHRDALDRLQRELQNVPGVTAIVYDQTCAAEKRRRRKAGAFPDPARRVVINELVCEGCGDCGVQSNCLSIVPIETEFGRKRQIDQQSCNKDFSCLKGFCPSFVTIEGGRLKTKQTLAGCGMLPPAEQTTPVGAVSRILLAGIGGTGVVTVGALLGMAARIEGLVASVNDVTGMAQKGGPVLGHVQIARDASSLAGERIPLGGADLLLAIDLVVATMPDAMSRLGPHTHAIANLDATQTGAFTRNIDALVDSDALIERLRDRVETVESLLALQAARAAVGDPIAAGLLMTGYAIQGGRIPIGPESMEEAIRMNGVAVDRNIAALRWGRRLAADPAAQQELGMTAPTQFTMVQQIERRAAFLRDYQDDRYAARYRSLIDNVRAAESKIMPDSDALTSAVAWTAFRLMTYKDEYEVARLHSQPMFRTGIAAQFEGDYQLRFHFSPPLLARRDRNTGRPRKIAFGQWVLPVLRTLASLRFLRGTHFDPFGWTAERKLERQLIVDYEVLVSQLCADLSDTTHALAVRLAELPAEIRGYGPVKQASLKQFHTARGQLLAELDRHSAPNGPTAPIPSESSQTAESTKTARTTRQ